MTRKAYTRTEDEAMLAFIVSSRRFPEIGGNKLWKYMEVRRVVENRSWQSMKERFRKKVLRHLDYFELTDSDREELIKRR